MNLVMCLTMQRAAIGCLCAATLAAAACADGAASPTSPSASAAVSGVAATPRSERTAEPALTASISASSPRSGELDVTKECSQFSTGGFCTITLSNLKAIEVGSRIVYLHPDELFTPLGTAVVLDPPGPGNNRAFGHCSLALGVCTFSGGTGKFTTFQARVDVTHTDDFSLWYWAGTYSFHPQD